jgi:hypothetical protein
MWIGTRSRYPAIGDFREVEILDPSQRIRERRQHNPAQLKSGPKPLCSCHHAESPNQRLPTGTTGDCASWALTNHVISTAVPQSDWSPPVSAYSYSCRCEP